jgi:hypothetical protein
MFITMVQMVGTLDGNLVIFGTVHGPDGTDVGKIDRSSFYI